MFFRNVFDLFSSPTHNSTPSITAVDVKPSTFTNRLTNIHYLGHKDEKDNGAIPHIFTDPIDYEIMDDPIKLDGAESQTFDTRSLTLSNTIRPGINPITNAPIKTQEKHAVRKGKIEAFVVGLEKIDALQKKLTELEKPIEQLDLEDDVSPEQMRSFLKEQNIEREKQLNRIKHELIDVLLNFIKNTEACIDSDEDRTYSEKEEEKATVLQDKKALVDSLLTSLTPKNKFNTPHLMMMPNAFTLARLPYNNNPISALVIFYLMVYTLTIHRQTALLAPHQLLINYRPYSHTGLILFRAAQPRLRQHEQEQQNNDVQGPRHKLSSSSE